LAQLNEQLGAFDVQLTPEDAAQLDRVSPWGGVIIRLFKPATPNGTGTSKPGN